MADLDEIVEHPLSSKMSYNEKQSVTPAPEDHQVQLEQDYREVGEKYGEDFLKKYNRDLNKTLIFAGLFSVVIAAFTVKIDSKMQPDSSNETAALLRILVHTLDNTTFGGNVPALPQWTGPPPAMVHAQAILHASLAASILTACLAMFGKQWLKRYSSTNMRGSAIERSQGRRRKFDRTIARYFDRVMESLPSMLQIALLLLGCALSLYLREIDTTIAYVVFGVTSFGALLYLLHRHCLSSF